MPEPIMKMFRVRLTRYGEDAGTHLLSALDPDDAVARAKQTAAEAKRHGVGDDNPFRQS